MVMMGLLLLLNVSEDVLLDALFIDVACQLVKPARLPNGDRPLPQRLGCELASSQPTLWTRGIHPAPGLLADPVLPGGHDRIARVPGELRLGQAGARRRTRRRVEILPPSAFGCLW